ncbi:membrane protein [Gordonia phage Clawz]|uniref:Membrane protein n=1 Tax=Gordonia phage Clawz TaxID=2743910 RepID=A0AAE7K6X2_9CAUD|nr:membrane protein [Gordonia phage Clawz]QKY79960.1 membrane protein [Gordonia phage Clawz]
MSSIWTSLLFSIAGLIFGFIGGQMIAWRRYGSLIIPTYHPRSSQRRADFIIGILVVALAMATLVQGVIAQENQTNCNNEFRRVLKERASLTQQQTLESRNLQQELIDIEVLYPPAVLVDPQKREDYIHARDHARQNYVKRLTDLDEQRTHNPYPDPRC